MDARIAERIIASGEPESLTPAELQLDSEPLTRTPVPRPVKVWARYGGVPVHVEAVATAWTARAVAVKWAAPGGQHRAWVWASAVE